MLWQHKQSKKGTKGHHFFLGADKSLNIFILLPLQRANVDSFGPGLHVAQNIDTLHVNRLYDGIMCHIF